MKTKQWVCRIAIVGITAGLSACQGSDESVTDIGGSDPDSMHDTVSIENLEVVGADGANVPTFANGNFGRIRLRGAPRTEEAEVKALRPTLDALGAVFRVDPAELSFQKVVTDNLGERHFVYAQRKNGLEVLGGALVLHTKNDVVYSVHGNARADLDAPLVAEIDEEEAVALAKEDSAQRGEIEVGAMPRMVYWPAGDKLDLVYLVNVTGIRADGTPVDEDVVVDAVSGAVVRRISNIHSFKNREVHDVDHGTASSLPGPIVRAEGGAAVADAVVNTNYNMLGTTYDCYKSLFNRDSYDNMGAKLVSSVHYGTSYGNAGWSSSKQQMLYGDGDGVTFGNMTGALDVTAHELTHAVTNATSNLYYYAQSGALNESMSDIFASVCEWHRDGQIASANTWKCAEDIYTPGTAGDALRYMNDPQKDGVSRDYYEWDYSAATPVHQGSGIANLAFYLLAQGGKHPRGRSTINVQGIGIAKAAQIFYRANTVTLLGNTMATFMNAKTATEQAAAQLGYSAADIASVNAAWQAVGVGTGLLLPGQTITVYNSVLKNDLSSPDGRFSLVVQSDGNLVLYWNGHGALWSTGTWGSQGKTATMQADGNFVLYTTSVPTLGASLWSSNTYGHPGAYLVLQNDGNLVVRDKVTAAALWNSGTGGH